MTLPADMKMGRHMSITPLRFVGISSFSEDFQAILNRAVSIAAVPVRQLQNQQVDLLAKKQSLSGLGTSVKTLADSVAALGSLGQSKAVTASSSNANRVSVTLNGSVLPSGYVINEVSSVAKAATEATRSGYASADADGVDGVDNAMELVLGGQTYSLDLSTYGNNLNGVRDAINALGIGLNATVLNTGSGATPYYLSLTATSTGATTLQLRTEAGTPASNILTATNQGANAVFKLNNLEISRADNVVTDVIDGLTFTIVSETAVGESVSLTVASNRGALATALQNLTTAYNGVRDKMNEHIGENAGLLSGDYIIRQVRSALQQLTGHRDGGTIQSLADLGISLSKTGEMSFDSARFYALPSATFNASFTFLGSAVSGFGGLSRNLRQISDPVSGLIRTQQNNYDAADRRIAATIATLTERIESMQKSLTEKLQHADVLLSSLTSQQNSLEASLQSLQLLTFGKKDR
jgi:flagellar hook-associated protein 2